MRTSSKFVNARRRATFFFVTSAISTVLVGIGVNLLTSSGSLTLAAGIGGIGIGLVIGAVAVISIESPRQVRVDSIISKMRDAKPEEDYSNALLILEQAARGEPRLRQEVVDALCIYMRIVSASFNESEFGRGVAPRQPSYILAQSILTRHLRSFVGQVENHEHWPDIDIDLRNVYLVDFDLSSTSLDRATFEGAQFHGVTKFLETYFRSYALFSNASFSGSVVFERARFAADAAFDRASFVGMVSFSGAIFDRDVIFSRAVFNGFADFSWARFNSLTYFDRAVFRRNVRFNRSDANGANYTWLSGFSCRGAVSRRLLLQNLVRQ